MWKKIGKYSDTLFLMSLVAFFALGGIWALWQWRVHQDDWQTNFEKYSVPMEAITDGGIGRDYRIVPIDRPRFETVSSAQTWLDRRTPVIVVNLHETVRAYPLTVLLRHEIVNDHIGATYFAVTFCPLCNSAIVYNRQVDGMVLRMGITGNLYQNGFLMWDDLTESWWQQFTGIAIVGDYTGRQLAILPAQVVGFGVFAQRYPEAQVLAGDMNQPSLNYAMNPYVGYDKSSSPLLELGDYDMRLPAMARVLAAVVDGRPVAYAFELLAEEKVINDTLEETPIVAFWQAGAASVLDAAMIENSQDVGMAALFGREINGRVLTFHYADGRFYDDETGSEWNIFGEAIAGALLGAKLPAYTCFSHFWFAWSSANPQTVLYTR